MSLGTVQKEARQEYMTQQELAEKLHLSRSMIAEIEAGRRRLPKDVAPKAVEILDCGFYAMEVAREMTGGSWVAKLNGENVDLHRASVKAKTQEELYEALEAINGICVANKPESMKEQERIKLEEAMIQAIDAIVALSHYVAIVCKEYGFSWLQLWRKHFMKLLKNGYVKET